MYSTERKFAMIYISKTETTNTGITSSYKGDIYRVKKYKLKKYKL
jgi:hypothetical protein